LGLEAVADGEGHAVVPEPAGIVSASVAVAIALALSRKRLGE
jgi:hypothetical protein